MWSSENERIGVKTCSYTAYLLTKIVYLSNIFSGITFLIFVCIILQKLLYSEFSLRLFLLLLIPIVIFAIGLILIKIADYLLNRKGFTYNYESDKCKWN